MSILELELYNLNQDYLIVKHRKNVSKEFKDKSDYINSLAKDQAAFFGLKKTN